MLNINKIVENMQNVTESHDTKQKYTENILNREKELKLGDRTQIEENKHN